MNELIALVLPYKHIFYYSAVAVAALLAILVVGTHWSAYFANKKRWCEHNNVKSLKDDPAVYRLFISMNNAVRKQFYLSVSFKFFTDYTLLLSMVFLYLAFTVLIMGYIIAV